MDQIRSFKDCICYITEDMRSRAVNLTLWRLLLDPITRFIILLRVNEYLLNRGVPRSIRAVPYLYYKRLSLRLGFTIPLNVFGRGLAIPHYGTIVVSPLAKVGKYCRIHVGVNIGATGRGKSSKAPVIGDGCYIGPGAKIFGGISIGSRCVIGANSVVGKSFPDGVTVAGVPARIISHRDSSDVLALESGENEED